MNIINHSYITSKPLIRRKTTTEVILHCTATPEGKDYTAETIDKWHKGNGWSCIGYHYIIYRDGTVHRGRPEYTIGAHCQNHNSKSIGICYVGGLEADGKKAKDTRTPEQHKAIIELVRDILSRYKLKLSNVHCHNEFATKACPCFTTDEFIKEYSQQT